MSDVLSDDGSDVDRDDSQEDVMTPAELIAKLEEVSWCHQTPSSLTATCGASDGSPVVSHNV